MKKNFDYNEISNYFFRKINKRKSIKGNSIYIRFKEYYMKYI